jgi:hypothetical protein
MGESAPSNVYPQPYSAKVANASARSALSELRPRAATIQSVILAHREPSVDTSPEWTEAPRPTSWSASSI